MSWDSTVWIQFHWNQRTSGPYIYTPILWQSLQVLSKPRNESCATPRPSQSSSAMRRLAFAANMHCELLKHDLDPINDIHFTAQYMFIDAFLLHPQMFVCQYWTPPVSLQSESWSNLTTGATNLFTCTFGFHSRKGPSQSKPTIVQPPPQISNLDSWTHSQKSKIYKNISK